MVYAQVETDGAESLDLAICDIVDPGVTWRI